jgi:hypothetical protein
MTISTTLQPEQVPSAFRRTKVRRPTGLVTAPLILIEGDEKAGKSWLCAEFSADDRIGQMYWIDLGEGSADEYGKVPGARYLMLDHDGTWTSIITAVEECRDEARRAAEAGEPPVVLTIDQMGAEWSMHKDWASTRARESNSNQLRLRKDPNAEIKVSGNYWNDANDRHARLMRLLMTFPGIVVMVARGKDVAAIGDDGQPTPNARDYRVEGQKAMAFDASVWVRMSRDSHPMIIGARSVRAGVKPTHDRLVPGARGRNAPRPIEDFSLSWLVFEYLGYEAGAAAVRALPDSPRTPTEIRDQALLSGTTADMLRTWWYECRDRGILTTLVMNENADEEELGAFLARLGKEQAGPRINGSMPAALAGAVA